MQRLNTREQVTATGRVRLDAGDGISLDWPVVPGLGDVSGLPAALAGKLGITVELGSNVDLDTVKVPAFYSQQISGYATTALHYPAAAAGRLLVMANPTGTQVSQMYWTFSTSSFRIYVRNFYSTWSAWSELNLGAPPVAYWRGDLPNGTDLNTLKAPGLWGASKTSIVSTLLNYPAQLNGTAGMVEVLAADNGLVVQRVTGYAENAITVQRTSQSVTSGTYTPWKVVGDDLAKYATTTYADSAAVAAAADAAGSYVQHQIRQTLFMQAMGGPVGTGGKAAFALRTDHGYKNMAEIVLPLCRARGIIPSTLYNPRNWSRPENTGYTLTDLRAWVEAGEVEVWNHGASHVDAATPAALYDEIVTGLAEVERDLPSLAGKVWGFAPPGVDPATGYGGYGGGSTPAQWDTVAGRLILKHHAVTAAYLPGTGTRVLDGQLRDGLSHYTMDSATVADLKTRIDEAITKRQGVQFMVHPYVVDTSGKITTAMLTEVLDYVATKRDAGELAVLTPYQLAIADSRLPAPTAAEVNAADAAYSTTLGG